jgi:spore photoproduct lyase
MWKIDKALIDEKTLESNIVKHFLKKYKDISYEIIKAPNEQVSLSKGKKILFFTENMSNFLKKCPGTPNYLCCLYNVLHLGEHCPMDCSYCILQVYFKNPYLTIFTNVEKMMFELENAEKEGEIVRVGSGEFTDSFALSEYGNWNEILIPFFAKSKNMFLELKSKSADSNFLRYKEHNRRIIISFSLNTIKVQKDEERYTSTIEQRIKLAKKAFENGFINSFHFDPIIDYPNCIKDYEYVINLLFDEINEKNICWISLGTLRFIPQLKIIATERFPYTKIYFQEFHTGIDGKYRYFIERRIEIYKKIVEIIKKRSKNTPLYFCMESKKVWQNVFGYAPKNNEDLSDYLDVSVKKVAKRF